MLYLKYSMSLLNDKSTIQLKKKKTTSIEKRTCLKLKLDSHHTNIPMYIYTYRYAINLNSTLAIDWKSNTKILQHVIIEIDKGLAISGFIRDL